MKNLPCVLVLFFMTISFYCQQIPDTIYLPKIEFKKEEIVYVDHRYNNFHRIDNRFMPFTGASKDLGKTFGFLFYDSFLLDENRRGIIDFTLKENTLGEHEIINFY